MVTLVGVPAMPRFEISFRSCRKNTISPVTDPLYRTRSPRSATLVADDAIQYEESLQGCQARSREALARMAAVEQSAERSPAEVRVTGLNYLQVLRYRRQLPLALLAQPVLVNAGSAQFSAESAAVVRRRPSSTRTPPGPISIPCDETSVIVGEANTNVGKNQQSRSRSNCKHPHEVSPWGMYLPQLARGVKGSNPNKNVEVTVREKAARVCLAERPLRDELPTWEVRFRSSLRWLKRRAAYVCSQQKKNGPPAG